MPQFHEWLVTVSLAFSSLKVDKLTFTLKPLLVYPDWPLSWETLVWFECCKLYLLCLSELSFPKEDEPPEGTIGTLGTLCYLCLLQPQLPGCEWMLFWLALKSISSFCFNPPIRGSFQTLNPLFNVIGHSWSLGDLWLSMWSPWPSDLHFFLYHSLNDGVETFLHVIPQIFYLCVSLSQIEWVS